MAEDIPCLSRNLIASLRFLEPTGRPTLLLVFKPTCRETLCSPGLMLGAKDFGNDFIKLGSESFGPFLIPLRLLI